MADRFGVAPPQSLAPGELLNLLSLTRNHKLRRELGTVLRRREPALWPDVGHNDEAWGGTLLQLLGSPQGVAAYGAAAVQVDGSLTPRDRLHVTGAAMRKALDRLRALGRATDLGPQTQPAEAIGRLLGEGEHQLAAVLAWAASLDLPGVVPDEAVRACLTDPELSRHFAASGGPGDGAAGDIRDLAAEVATAATLTPGLLERLSAAALAEADRLRRDAGKQARREAVLSRLAALPDMAVPGGLPTRLETGDIELDLLEALVVSAEENGAALEAAATALTKAVVEGKEASRKNFALAGQLAATAEGAREAYEASLGRLSELLSPNPIEPPAEPAPGHLPIEPLGPSDAASAGLPEGGGLDAGTGGLTAAAPSSSNRGHGPLPGLESGTGPAADGFPDGALPTEFGLPQVPDAQSADDAEPAAASESGSSPLVVDEEIVHAGEGAPTASTRDDARNLASLEGTDAPEKSGGQIPHPAAPGPSNEGAEQPRLEAATVAALSSGRLGLAQALLQLGALGPASPVLLHAVRLTAAAQIAQGTGEVDDTAREFAADALAAWQAGTVDPQAELAAASLLFPASVLLALLAPGCNAAGLLTALVGGGEAAAAARACPNLLRIGQAVEDASRRLGGNLVPDGEALSALVSEDQRKQAAMRLQAEAATVLRDGRLRTVRYSRATDVWYAMLDERQRLGRMLAAVARGEDAGRVRHDLEAYDFDEEMRRVERLVRRHKAASDPIRDPAYAEMARLSQQAVAPVQQWVTLFGRTTGAASIAGPLAELLKKLLGLVPAARRELEELARHGGITGSFATAALPLLSRLDALLHNEAPEPAAPTIEALLGRDVLGSSSIEMGHGWTWSVSARSAEELASLAERAPTPLAEAVRARAEAGQFIAAELGLALLSDGERSELERTLDQKVEEARARASATIDRLVQQVEEAGRSGRLRTGDAERLAAAAHQLEGGLRDAVRGDFAALLPEVERLEEDVRATLDRSAEALRERIRRRLDQLANPAAARERVEEALRDGQLAIAEDLVERLEENAPLDAALRFPPVTALFDAFFPQRVDALDQWLRATRSGVARIKEAPPELVPPGSLAEGGGLLDAWTACERGPSEELRAALVELFRNLGFTAPRLVNYAQPSRQETEARFELETRELRDRAAAILPEYGSAARGRYRLLCLWGKRSADELRQAVRRDKSGGRPTFVLFFGTLGRTARDTLAAAALPVVLDRVLACHLASVSESRLLALFACTLPFTGTRPWADTGTPGPEMFFGRQRELQLVEALQGESTQLLYGGRQLGKTAVLRQAERAAGADPDTVAAYRVIAQIGLTEAPEALWRGMAEALREQGVAMPPEADSSPRSFGKAVREWLGVNPARRILLLLDEADRFFAADRRKHYPITEELRTLCLLTDRRFKPVFAGLQNVQRMARDPNSPLAHLGQPRAVGPLIRGAERQEAEALIRWPFEALGYRLDRAAVTRILSFANYYPSLIQVVCQALLRQLRTQPNAGGPPWTVGIQTVEAVLRTRELTDAAFDRFRITLELDQRYNLLALATSLESVDQPRLLADGLPVRELRFLAAEYWPAGFPPDMDEDMFEGLLDEMASLGVLRKAGASRYALRSENLLHLIGTRPEIEQRLETFRHKDGPSEPDPLAYRRPVAGQPSILSARQEAELLTSGPGVTIVAGLRLAGIEDWRKAIEAAIEAQKKRAQQIAFQQVATGASQAAFTERVDAACRQHRSKGLQLLVVPPETGWSVDWVLRAKERLLRGRANVRVVFIADAARAWDWVVRRPDLRRDSPISEHGTGPLSRAALALWLSLDEAAQHLPGWCVGDPGAVLAATGGWTRLLPPLATAAPPTNGGAGKLAEQLLAQGSDGVGLVDDIRALAGAERTLAVVKAGQELRKADEVSDLALLTTAAAIMEHEAVADGELGAGVEWALLVGAVTNGQYGYELNPALDAALARPGSV